MSPPSFLLKTNAHPNPSIAAGDPVSRLGASRGHGQYPALPQSSTSIGTQPRLIDPGTVPGFFPSVIRNLFDDVDAVVLIRDTDDQPDRINGLNQAKNRFDGNRRLAKRSNHRSVVAEPTTRLPVNQTRQSKRTVGCRMLAISRCVVTGRLAPFR
jgi:hypothetical protein